MITLVVITDGRDCIYDTIPSALDYLRGPISRKIIYDDSGAAPNRARLADRFPEFVLAHCERGRQGFGGAIRHMWKYLGWHDTNPWLFWLEDDFLFKRDVDLNAMASVLEERPNLAQLVLRRQPWNAEERAAGGIVERHPDEYIDFHDGHHDWLEHRRFWSTNPHLTRMNITRLGWPEDPHSEGKFTQRLLGAAFTPFGFWGARTDAPWVEHVGHERAGMGY